MKTIRECEGDNQFEFGEGGSLSNVRFLTKCAQSCNVRKVGYCGVMLPVLEDAKLTQLWKQVCVNLLYLLESLFIHIITRPLFCLWCRSGYISISKWCS